MDLEDLFRSDCPGRQVMEHLTGKWGVLVLVALKDGPLRFHRLRDRIEGISEKMLSQNLRVLGRDGLLDRFVEPSTPPQVTYSLTPLGEQAVAHLCELFTWIARSAPQIIAAQERHDRGL
ncbi:winged helix-turn-helix transcriptional regulator [Nonomuraea candida]|uniref:winged helix-turn-helix transcriptional regulator n=1 Tax=Nonomuraea candida TaxID=359159 RepID=UPI0005BD19DA|nr:helix-turn-helix domain-containing protein [Nonomuraea candida]